MRKILCWFSITGMLYFVAVPGLAQSSNTYLIDYTKEGAWRYTSVRETPYQSNGRVIQHQLIALGKRLNHLSVVDAPAYSQLQSDLRGYLQRLENDSPIMAGQTCIMPFYCV